eukprot:762616-Hanusia_phi.AAC.5
MQPSRQRHVLESKVKMMDGDDCMPGEDCGPNTADVAAVQGAQAGTLLATDAADASIATEAAAAAGAATELIPLVLLRQTQKPLKSQTKQQKLQQGVLDAPYRLAGYRVGEYDSSAPSADPWSGNSEMVSVPVIDGAAKRFLSCWFGPAGSDCLLQSRREPEEPPIDQAFQACTSFSPRANCSESFPQGRGAQSRANAKTRETGAYHRSLDLER